MQLLDRPRPLDNIDESVEDVSDAVRLPLAISFWIGN